MRHPFSVVPARHNSSVERQLSAILSATLDRPLLAACRPMRSTPGIDPNAPVVNGRYRATQSGFGLLTRGYIAFTSSHKHNVNNGHTRRTVSRAFRTTCV